MRRTEMNLTTIIYNDSVYAIYPSQGKSFTLHKKYQKYIFFVNVFLSNQILINYFIYDHRIKATLLM
jgi:hypothetical protein